MADNQSHSEISPRNLIASVLHIEIAQYAERPVFEQIQLTALLHGLIDSVSLAIDTGDWFKVSREESIAIIFPSEPSACFQLARRLKDALDNQSLFRDAPFHIGLNLGPVNVSTSELGLLQVSGQGVDDAAQIARGGELGEILISRAFYAVLARVCKDYGLLQYKAFVSDERDETIAVYRIADNVDEPDMGTQARVPDTTPAVIPRRNSHWAYTAVPATMLLAAVIMLANRPPVTEPQPTLALAEKTIAVTPSLSPSHSPSHSPPAATPAAEINVPEPKVAESPPALVIAEQSTSVALPADSFVLATAVTDSLQPAPVFPKSGTLRLAVKPWGEVYVDGKKVGVTPPLHKITVKSGKRKIEVRNANFLPYSAIVDVKPQSFLSIAHQFDLSKSK